MYRDVHFLVWPTCEKKKLYSLNCTQVGEANSGRYSTIWPLWGHAAGHKVLSAAKSPVQISWQ